MKNFFALVGMAAGLMAITPSAVYAAAEPETIKAHMEDTSFGEAIKPAELKGHYVGTCYEAGQSKTEALFFNSFVNAKGDTVNLGVATLQTYDGYELPSPLAFLLQPGQQGWDYVENFIKNGLSGTDNNIGKVSVGADFKNLYTSSLAGNTLTVAVSVYRDCSNGICSPPLLQACRYGYNEGRRVYDGCVRNGDQTVLKKESDGVLISHRTAEGVGEPVNSLSFYLAPISTYCRWTKTL